MGKHHSLEFKRAAVARVQAGESPMDVSRSVGVKNTSSIYKWISQLKGSDAKPKPAPSKPIKGPSGRTIIPLALKQRAIHLVKIEGKPPADVAKELRVKRELVTRWARVGVKTGALGEAAPALIPAPQVVVAQPTRQHRGPPSAFSNKDTRQYLLMWEQSVLAGIRDGRIKNLRDNPEIGLTLNALLSVMGADE